MSILAACACLTNARRYQEVCQTSYVLFKHLPDLKAEWAARQIEALGHMTEALEHFAKLTGSPTVGEMVLSRTNALIRAEKAQSQAHLDLQAAQSALRCAARDALDAEAQEIRDSLAQAASDEARALLLTRLATVEQFRKEVAA